MTEDLLVPLVLASVYILGGCALQWAERFWPFRTQPAAPSTRLDWLAFVLHRAYGPLLAATTAWIAGVSLLSWSGTIHQALEVRTPILGLATYYLTYDFCVYWLHRLQHAPALWSTHAFHHSPRHLNWLSGVRESPIHHVFMAVPPVIASLVASLHGPAIWVGILYANLHNSFIHSNLRVRSHLFTSIFMTGEHHFIHHATDLRLGNSNFGFIFTLWDRVFGTYVDPAAVPANFPLGLGYPISTARLMLGLPPATEGSPERASVSA